MSTWVACLIVFAIYAIYIGVIRPHTPAEKEKAREAAAVAELNKLIADNCCTYDKTHYTLSLRKGGVAVANAITIVDYVHYTTAYEPEKYVYTSASVGGITTGGFTKTGGYDYISDSKKTNKCQMKIGGESILRIQLTDELYEKAKKSEVSSYLNHDKKQISVVVSVPISSVESEVALRMAQAGDFNLARSQGEQGYPTREKCEKILDWIRSA